MFCFLCGVLGHGEAQCPLRYSDVFQEPEKGFPFGNWLRVSDDTSQGMGAPLPLQAKRAGSNASQGLNIVPKRGEEIFGVSKDGVQQSGGNLSIRRAVAIMEIVGA